MRLAKEPEEWRDVAAAFERALAGNTLAPALALELNRQLARIAAKRLGDPERARGYLRQVLVLQPDDKDAESQLEELAGQVADWTELLASYRRRAERERDKSTKAGLLMEIAALQEQKLMDLDGAAATYHQALETVPGHASALRALARIEEARGDWESLSEVLAQELAQTPRWPAALRSADAPRHARGPEPRSPAEGARLLPRRARRGGGRWRRAPAGRRGRRADRARADDRGEARCRRSGSRRRARCCRTSSEASRPRSRPRRSR